MNRAPVPDGNGGPHVFVESLAQPELSDDDHHHLSRVRRLRDGDPITLSDGAGSWCAARFAAAPEIAGDLVSVVKSEVLVSVGIVAVKGDRTAWAVQKLTEIGVDRILLLSSSRSVVRWTGDRGPKAHAKLIAVARSAATQSRRVFLPIIEPSRPAVDLMAEPGVAVAQRGGQYPSLDYPTVLIGPEGGWTNDELAAAGATVDLGVGVLRAETAAVVAGALLAAIRADIVHRHAE